MTDVILAAAADIDATVDGQNVLDLFSRARDEFSSQVALRGAGGEIVTYAELAERVARCAAGLRALGVGRGDRVVMMLRNRVEFHVCDLAVLCCGATPISIYNSSSVDQITYLAAHSRARTAIVGDEGFLQSFVRARPDLPELEQIVVVDASGDLPDGVVRFSELDTADPIDLDAAAAKADPGDLATVIYTSGTTGSPKGVMITHRNVCWTIESLRRTMQIEPRPWRVVSYLPMAHIAERMVSHYQMVAMGYEVTPLADVAQLAETLVEVRPNLMFGVPRVYEKIHAGINAKLAADPDRFAQFNDGIQAARPIAQRRAWGTNTSEDDATWEFLDGVAFGPVRAAAGTGSTRGRRDRRGADVGRSARVVPSAGCAAVRGLRHVRVDRADELGALPDQAGFGRPGDRRGGVPDR